MITTAILLLFPNIVCGFGATFGDGLAGVAICGTSQPPHVVVNHTLLKGETHGVIHHFWCTGAQFKIDRMWVEYWVDGESKPSISYQPSMSCGFAFPERAPHDFEYAAGGLCGKSAPVGGWWNTFPIPFYKSIVVTVRAHESDGTGCFNGYVNIRGTAELPLILPQSGIPLPFGTRMILQKNPLTVRQPLEYVTLGSLPSGQKGMIFMSAWAVDTMPVGGPQAGGGYIEGCWTFYRQANESFPGLVVGTGVEDYFDSGYYFGADSGDAIGVPFFNALSGLTLFERTKDGYERLSAYRFHTADPLIMSDGGRLVWRVGAQGQKGTYKCGNPRLESDTLSPVKDNAKHLDRTLSPINVTTYAWIYTFPSRS